MIRRQPSSFHPRLALPHVSERFQLMLIAVVVGLGAGAAAVLLSRSIIFVEHWLLAFRSEWWAFLLPAVGAALAYLFLRYVIRERPGHGVPEVIDAISRNGAHLPPTSMFSRLVSSCLTIGSGGSAGPEAPVVMSGATIGSTVGRLFRLNERQRTTMVGAGAAAAVAAIFNAPIAGMIFAIEVILGQLSGVNVVPIAIAAVSGTLLSHSLSGNQIPFPHTAFEVGALDVVASAGLALATAAGSLWLTYAMRAGHRAWSAVRVPGGVRAALGGAVVGGIGLLAPEVLGEGYGSVQAMITADFDKTVWMLVALLALKIIATSSTLGSGGSGGIFAPSLVVGALIGLAFHRTLTMLWPDVHWVGEGCFALLGMAGLMGGILQAPLSGIFLVLEITGSYSVILPLIVVSAVSSTVCHLFEPSSIYMRELMKLGHLRRPGTDARVLADLQAREFIEHENVELTDVMPLRQLVEAFRVSHRNHLPVMDSKTSRFVGLVHLNDVRGPLFDPRMYDAVLVGELVDSSLPEIDPETSLSEVLEQMDATGAFALPVVENGVYLGLVSKGSVLDTYRKELIVQTGI